MTPEEQIAQMTVAGLRGFAADMVDDMQQSVGINYPPASDPFQKPHLRTGELQRGIGVADVTEEGPLITVVIISNAPYSLSLENGRENMLPRPFIQPALDKWLPVAPDYLQDAYEGRGTIAPTTTEFPY